MRAPEKLKVGWRETGRLSSRGDVARAAALNEQELWREMVRWSGGLVHEEGGLLFVSGPSSYLRVMIRMDPAVDGALAVRRAGEFFGASEGGHIVNVREPDDVGPRSRRAGRRVRAGLDRAADGAG
jgi:hypothetical protein